MRSVSAVRASGQVRLNLGLGVPRAAEPVALSCVATAARTGASAVAQGDLVSLERAELVLPEDRRTREHG